MKNELLPPCGLYCGLCGIHYATEHNDDRLRGKLAAAYGVPAESLVCNGCLSGTVFLYCRECAVKNCAAERKLEGCHLCGEFPCEKIESFPVPEARANMLRAVPEWKRLGTEEWIRSEMKLFSCKSCGTQMFRGAKKCRECGAVRE